MDIATLIARAVELHVAGDLDGAAAAYRETLAADPAHAHALGNLAVIVHGMGNFDEAIRLHEAAIAANPGNAIAHSNLGVALTECHRYQEAVAAYERALTLAPKYFFALSNLGDALVNLGRYGEAVSRIREALELKPDFGQAHCNLGRAYWGQGRMEAAIGEFRVAIALDPKDPLPHKNLGMALLMCGSFAEGWAEFEYRYAADRIPPRPFELPFWNGRPVMQGRLLVWAEQGPGDEIWQASMASDLARVEPNFVWEVSPRLLALFQRSMPNLHFVPRQDPPDDTAARCMAQVPAASIGRLLRPSAESFPSRRSFLRADQGRIAEIREKLDLPPGEKLIGVSWLSKNLSYGNKKSTRLADWRDLLKTPGCRFVNLQYGDTSEERADVDGLLHIDGLDLLDDLDGVAALISLCDAVITVSNTTAHLAGALGVETWILVDAGGGRLWCWGDETVTKPLWYPSATIVRRPAGAPWSAAIAIAETKLKTFLQMET